MVEPLSKKDVYKSKDIMNMSLELIEVVRLVEVTNALKKEFCLYNPDCVKQITPCVCCEALDRWLGGVT